MNYEMSDIKTVTKTVAGDAGLIIREQPTVRVRFDPQYDITAWELVKILQLDVVWLLPEVWDELGPAQRHFKKEKE